MLERNQDEKYWQEVVFKWQESHLSQAEFCRRQGIDQNVFSKNKIRFIGRDTSLEKKGSKDFVEVKLSTEEKEVISELDLFVGDNYRIKLRLDFDSGLLKKVLAVIGGVQ